MQHIWANRGRAGHHDGLHRPHEATAQPGRPARYLAERSHCGESDETGKRLSFCDARKRMSMRSRANSLPHRRPLQGNGSTRRRTSSCWRLCRTSTGQRLGLHARCSAKCQRCGAPSILRSQPKAKTLCRQEWHSIHYGDEQRPEALFHFCRYPRKAACTGSSGCTVGRDRPAFRRE